MRICIVSPSYPSLPAAGGIAVYSQIAARGLAQRGHEVHVLVGLLGERRDFTDGFVRIHVRPVRWLPVVCRWLPGLGESICLAWHLWRLHRKCPFDVVEFSNWEGPGLVAAVLRFVPIVVRLHTSTWETVELAQRPPTQTERFLMWSERTTARMASAVVTHSETHRQLSAGRLGLANITVIPHGIPLPPRPVATMENSHHPIVLSVGFLNPRKGADVLIEAIPLVLQAVPTAIFWIVGSDPQRQYETALRCKNPQIENGQVKFFGFVPGEELPRYYQQCTVYVSPSRYESFGLTFVEAMAHGKPVVGCEAGAVPEVVESGVTGLLVPPDDPSALAKAIVHLLQDPAMRERLGQAGRERVEQRYSEERMVKDIEGLYRRVIEHATR